LSKSQRLRLCDVKNVHRLLGECRDLGADPIAWRRRLIERLMQLTGARVGYLVGLTNFPSSATGADEMVQMGLDGPAQEKLFVEHFEFIARGGEDVMLRFFAALQLDRLRAHSSHHVLDLDEWYGSESFQRYHRRMDMDAGILSMCRLGVPGPPCHHTVSLRRCVGEPPFTLREVRLVRYLHQELAPQIGRCLAPTHEPSACELSPRLQQTLQGLLNGLSEKQIAERLCISPTTLHEYVTTLYRRFNVSGRSELMARWIRYGTGTASRDSVEQPNGRRIL
jgi:DNA-binding CsgD family transcriptional regulator